MDFSFNAAEEAFRAEVRQFIKDNPPEKYPVDVKDAGFGMGAWSFAYARMIASKGWVDRFWPKEYGGEGESLVKTLIKMEEFAYAEAPLNSCTTGESVARLIIKHGNDFLKKEFLPKIAKADISFWLAFSEPNAGSDLLGLETKGKKDGDYYIVNGQKTWSSNAHLAHYGYCLVRTNPDVPRHKGLSMFILDKTLPGVSIRPLYNMAGVHYHNEVFLDDVKIHKDYLIGGENQGFYQMLAGLEHDRFWARFVKAPYCKKLLEQIAAYAGESKEDGKRLSANPFVRNRFAELVTENEALNLLFYRIAWMLENKKSPTYEGVLAKAFADELGQRVCRFGLEVFGLYPRPQEDPKWDLFRQKFAYQYQSSLGHTLAGGPSEIMRNTTAARGLAMPQE